MSDITQLIRKDLQSFVAYSSARKEAGLGRIQMNANESPWENQLADRQALNRYTDQQPINFLEKMADYYQVKTEQILLTRGSDEGIDLLIRLFCNAGVDAVMQCTPTFGMYEVFAKLQAARVITVPLTADFELDSEKVLQIIDPTVKIVFLCTPNNPTGNTLDREGILELCEQLQDRALVVVDEAYIEFADVESLASAIDHYPNLVVLRTLSKAFGLAAARIGTVLANETVILWLKKILAPYPLSLLSIRAAEAALSETAKKQTAINVSIIKTERIYLSKALQSLPIVKKVWPSQANFLLVEFSEPVYERCLQEGIVLRDMSQRLNLPNTVRISIGRQEENAELITLLRTCCA